MVYTEDELAARLESAALRYITPDTPGYTRKKRGKGFIYLDKEKRPIDKPELKAWIESLVIPPAWKEVWISPYKNGHILATGRDEKGRKQYIYHPKWQETANEKKFEDLIAFGEALQEIRIAVEHDLARPEWDQHKMVALVVSLLEKTLIRIGNEEYKRDNETFGLTTLQDNHVGIKGGDMSFEFVGKSGKPHTITVRDKRLARLVKRSQDLPGETLFQYLDSAGNPHPIDSSHVNTYLQSITGKPFTAKIFRTWGGSVRMVRELCTTQGGDTKKAREKCVRTGVKAVAKALGNTTDVSRAYYIHPLVIDAFMEERLKPLYEEYLDKVKEEESGLRLEEQILMALMLTAREAASQLA